MSKEGVASLVDIGHSAVQKMYGGSSAMYGKVYDILLDLDATHSKQMNVPVGTIGAIQFRVVSNNVIDETSPTITAIPLDRIKRVFPINNEIVQIISGPTYNARNAKGNVIPTFYYDRIVDIWNSSEHNSVPDSTTSGSATGVNFIEKGTVRRLQHLPGDVIEEGRFGNSIRIGSSNGLLPNTPWQGPEGNPILIIRNGQAATSGLITFEDINNDDSSLYFLSGQTVNFSPANFNFDSYGETVKQTTRANVVISPNLPPVADNTSVQQTDAAVPPPVDTPTTTYPTSTVASTNTPQDEINYLPDSEDQVYSQEFESDGPRHTDELDSTWTTRIGGTTIDTNITLNTGVDGDYDPYFIAYMMHQQGPAGVKAILYYAKQGASIVPTPNTFVTNSKENVQRNMFGTYVYPSSSRTPNIGSDYLQIFRGVTPLYTPGNFIKYWKNKYPAKIKEASSGHTQYDSIFMKYAAGLPLSFIKGVCDVESSFNPNKQNDTYKGLFQVSLKEFQSVFPGDTDIFNVDKNSKVGIGLLHLHYNQATALINSL